VNENQQIAWIVTWVDYDESDVIGVATDAGIGKRLAEVWYAKQLTLEWRLNWEPLTEWRWYEGSYWHAAGSVNLEVRAYTVVDNLAV